MKRILSLLLCLTALLTTFCACGKKQETEAKSYDSTQYAVSYVIDGVGFLYPAGITTKLVSWDTYEASGSDLQEESYAEYKTDDCYAFLKPGQIGIYCFSLGRRNHLEGRTDMKTLANWLGISHYINFAARGTEQYTTEHVENQYTKNVFPVTMKDTIMQETLYGYVAVLKDDSNNNFYVYAVGSVSEDADDLAAAKEMADYFCLHTV